MIVPHNEQEEKKKTGRIVYDGKKTWDWWVQQPKLKSIEGKNLV